MNASQYADVQSSSPHLNLNYAIKLQPNMQALPNHVWFNRQGVFQVKNPLTLSYRLIFRKLVGPKSWSEQQTSFLLRRPEPRFVKRGWGHLGAFLLRKRYRRFGSKSPNHSPTPLHSDRLWALSYLNSLQRISLLGLPPSRDYYFLEKGTKWSEESTLIQPHFQEDKSAVESTSTLTARQANVKLNAFFRFIALKNWELGDDEEIDELPFIHPQTYLNGAHQSGPRARTKFRIQPYTFLGLKGPLSGTMQSSSVDLRRWLRAAPRLPQVVGPDIIHNAAPANSLLEDEHSTKSWSRWLERTLDSSSVRAQHVPFTRLCTPKKSLRSKLSDGRTLTLFSRMPLKPRLVNSSNSVMSKVAPSLSQSSITNKGSLRITVGKVSRIKPLLSLGRTRALRLRYVRRLRYVPRMQAVGAVRTYTHSRKNWKQLKCFFSQYLLGPMHFWQSYKFKRKASIKSLRKSLGLNLSTYVRPVPSSRQHLTSRTSTLLESLPSRGWLRAKAPRLQYSLRKLKTLRTGGKALVTTRFNRKSKAAPSYRYRPLITLPTPRKSRSLVKSLLSYLPKPVLTQPTTIGEYATRDSRSALLDFPQRVTVSPLYSPYFSRSPFFFLNRTLLKTKLTDLLSTVRNMQPQARYLVFPDANDLKVSVFKRLNQQKALHHNRFLSASATRLLGQDSPLLRPQPTLGVHFNNFRSQPSPLQYFASVTRKSTHLANLLPDYQSEYPKAPRIRRIRFKPGYGRIWRAGRKSIKDILRFHHRYQYRLTPKLQMLYFQQRQYYTQAASVTSNVGFALMTCRFAPDIWSVKKLLNSGTVFLNGTAVSNPETRLFANDFMQLVVHIKFYVAAKWVQNYSSIRKNKVNKVFYRKFRPSTRDKTVRVVRTLPTWFYDLQYAFSDVPRFFEVDYFTLSVFMIHDELALGNWTPSRANLFDTRTLNMYNWKYIT